MDMGRRSVWRSGDDRDGKKMSKSAEGKNNQNTTHTHTQIPPAGVRVVLCVAAGMSICPCPGIMNPTDNGCVFSSISS